MSSQGGREEEKRREAEISEGGEGDEGLIPTGDEKNEGSQKSIRTREVVSSAISDTSKSSSQDALRAAEVEAKKKTDEFVTAEEGCIDPKLSVYEHVTSTMTNALVSMISTTRIGAFGDKTDPNSESAQERRRILLPLRYKNGGRLLSKYENSWTVFWYFLPVLIDLCWISPLKDIIDRWNKESGFFHKLSLVWEFIVTFLVGTTRFVFGLLEGIIRISSVPFNWFSRVDQALELTIDQLQKQGKKKETHYLYSSFDPVKYIKDFEDLGRGARTISILFIRIPVKLLNYFLVYPIKVIFDKAAFFLLHVCRILNSFGELFRFTGNGIHAVRMLDSFLRIL